jgi:tetratricopeptide (TPR) repeat protein
MMLGWAYMLRGQYEQAEPHLGHAAQLERSESSLGFRKVGGLTLLGNLRLRQGRPDEARTLYEESLQYLDSFEHVYRDTFKALTYCGLGEVAFRGGWYDAALEYFGQAVDLAESRPERLGIGYFFVKGCAGMGRAFFALDVNPQARERIERATAALAAESGFDFLAMWEGNHGQAHFDLARAAALINEPDQACSHLEEAVRLGWGDLNEVEADPGFRSLEVKGEYKRILTSLRDRVPLD